MRNGRFNVSSPPVREGDELEVSIEAVGEKGDGIARYKGFVLFVPNTKKGDVVKVRVSKVLRSVGFADVLGKVEKPEAPPEPEFDPEEHKDTEDFGEE